MDKDTQEKLLEMLKTVMGGYGKPAPEPEIFKSWVEFLKPYSLSVILRSLADHCNHSDFSPTAAVIARGCRELDSRPTADEAWAIALSSVDESETVVWTAETARAFASCRPILDIGDKVGARMAFRDTYSRLVYEARLSRIPVKWETSLGLDSERREVAIAKAKSAGLIGNDVLMLGRSGNSADLPPFSEESQKAVSEKVRALLDALRETPQRLERERIARLEAERMAVEVRKQEIAHAASAYGKGEP